MDITRQFKALSDPTRLRLLNILNQCELSVSEIVSIVDMIQSGVSRHLKILLESGLLISRKQGSFIYYSANRTHHNQTLIDYVCTMAGQEPVCCQDLERARQSIEIRKNRSRRFFSTIAPQWDRLKKEVLGEFNLNHALKDRIKGADAVADLGCGTGELLECLHMDKKGFGACRLIGVDASPEMLEQARIRLSFAPAINLRLGELENLPMRDREVDAVIMSMVLFHIFDPPKAIEEAARVLKPSGRLVLADFDKHGREDIKKIIGGVWMGFTRSSIDAQLNSSGFNPLKYQRFKVSHDLYISLFTADKI